jgi:hypothetical protein
MNLADALEPAGRQEIVRSRELVPQPPAKEPAALAKLDGCGPENGRSLPEGEGSEDGPVRQSGVRFRVHG